MSTAVDCSVSSGCHVQLADGEAEAVGGGQGEPRPVDLHADAGEHRQRVVAAGGHRDLRDGGRQLLGGDGARQLRHRGQLRVVLDRHGGQAEPAAAAVDRGPGPVDDEVDRLGGQRAGDVGQQPAGDEHAAGIADGGLDLDAGRGLVVEPGDGEPLAGGPAGCLDEDAAQNRNRRARRKAARDPCGRIGQDVAFDPELHGGDLSRLGVGQTFSRRDDSFAAPYGGGLAGASP